MEQSVYIRSFGLNNVKQQRNFLTSFLSMILIAGMMMAVEVYLKEEDWRIIALSMSCSLLLMVVTAFKNPGEFPKIVTAVDSREGEGTNSRFHSGLKNQK